MYSLVFIHGYDTVKIVCLVKLFLAKYVYSIVNDSGTVGSCRHF